MENGEWRLRAQEQRYIYRMENGEWRVHYFKILYYITVTIFYDIMLLLT